MHAIMLCRLEQDVMFQLICGFGASDSSSLAMHGARCTQAQPRRQARGAVWKLFPICSNTVNADSQRRRRASPMSRLGLAQNIGR